MTTTSNKPRIQLSNEKAIHTHVNKIIGMLAIYTHIIFLDFDGVLHGFRGAGMFEHKERFEKILRDHPHVMVVFSTSWRFNQSFEQMVGWFSEDVRHRFVGVTPTVQEKWPPYTMHEREKECLKYIEEVSWTGKWVAIDDAKDLFRPDCENLIITEGNIGMDDVTQEKLIAHLL
jgi:hypothetical protein